MTIVSISEAAKIVRKGRATLYRDMEKGRLSKTVSPSGEVGIETSELVRVYGQLYLPETPTVSTSLDDFETKIENWSGRAGVSSMSREAVGDTSQVAILEEKIRAYEHRIELLERIASLEATVRRDTTAALKAQLADKDVVLKTLENQVLLLSYSKEKEVVVIKQPWWKKVFA